MQQKMLRTSMATNPEHRRLLQGVAAAFGGSLVPFPGSVLAAASHRFAIGEHHVLLDGKPLPIRCGEMRFAPVPREYGRHCGALNAIDDQNSDYRITAWSGKDAGTAAPQRLVIDLGKRSDVTGAVRAASGPGRCHRAHPPFKSTIPVT